MSRHRRHAVVLAALLLTAAGCADGGADPARTGTTSPASTPPGTSSGSPAAGGSPDAPVVVEPVPDLLDWSPAPGRVEDTVTVSGPWTLTVDPHGRRVTLEGPEPESVAAGRDRRVSEALIDGEYALVVSQDRLEQRPAVATVIELATGRRLVLDGTSEVPTTTGGTWALGAGHLLHATRPDVGAVDRYCLARVDLASGRPEVAWCAGPGQGFTHARITGQGDTLLTFDDSQPSCRTVATVSQGDVAPFAGVAECRGWDGVVLEGGRVWSVVLRESRIDDAHLYATVGDGYYDLGPGTSGSLVECAGAAYFSRDPAREGDPAQVLRWRPDGTLAVVYEAPTGGEGFVTVPLRCGGDRLTLTALTESGDEQVTAPVG